MLTFANRSMALVVAWLIYQQTHDELSLGLIGLCEALPFLSTALFAGITADHYNRRIIVLFCASAYLSGALFLAAFLWFHQSDQLPVFPLYLLIFLLGIVRGFYAPAHGAMAAQLIPRKLYPFSAVWNSISFDISAVSGPACAGLMYAYFGALAAVLLVVACAMLSLYLFFSTSELPHPPFQKSEGVFVSLKEGLRFVFGTQQLVGAFAVDMFAVLFGGVIAILPAFADKILHCGPEFLGYLQAAPAAGAICMSLILSVRPPQKNAGKKMLLSVAAFGCCMIAFAFSKTFLTAWIFLFLSGIFDEVSVIIRSTIVQLYAPENMRGRVEAVSKIFIGSSNELGAFESGLAARFFGLVPSIVAGGCITLMVSFFAWMKLHEIRELDTSKDPTEE